jgi:hypothetical protein
MAAEASPPLPAPDVVARWARGQPRKYSIWLGGVCVVSDATRLTDIKLSRAIERSKRLMEGKVLVATTGLSQKYDIATHEVRRRRARHGGTLDRFAQYWIN